MKGKTFRHNHQMHTSTHTSSLLLSEWGLSSVLSHPWIGGPAGNTLWEQPENLMPISGVSPATCFNTGSQCRATKWKGSLSSFWVGSNQGLIYPIFQGMNNRRGSVRVLVLCGCQMPLPPCILNCSSQHPTQMTPCPSVCYANDPEYATQMSDLKIQTVLSSPLWRAAEQIKWPQIISLEGGLLCFSLLSVL